MTTNFYRGANNAALLVTNKRNLEEKVDVYPEGTTVNKQEQTTTKQLATQKIHANNICWETTGKHDQYVLYNFLFKLSHTHH